MSACAECAVRLLCVSLESARSLKIRTGGRRLSYTVCRREGSALHLLRSSCVSATLTARGCVELEHAVTRRERQRAVYTADNQSTAVPGSADGRSQSVCSVTEHPENVPHANQAATYGHLI
jgi:hypothetical protein